MSFTNLVFSRLWISIIDQRGIGIVEGDISAVHANLELPNNIVEGSARAQVTAIGVNSFSFSFRRLSQKLFYEVTKCSIVG